MMKKYIFYLVLFSFFSLQAQWIQIGADINGEAGYNIYMYDSVGKQIDFNQDIQKKQSNRYVRFRKWNLFYKDFYRKNHISQKDY
jgi:hypothetical protein